MTSPKKSYGELLQSPEWQKIRLKVFNRDKFTCKLCKDTKNTLHVHHKSYENGKLPWEYPLSNFISLCAHCHLFVEELKKGKLNIGNIENIKAVKFTRESRFGVCAIIGGNIQILVFKDNTQDMWLSLSKEAVVAFLPVLKSFIKDGVA